MAEIAFRMLISLTLKDPVNMESVVFRDPKNITRGGVPGGGPLKGARGDGEGGVWKEEVWLYSSQPPPLVSEKGSRTTPPGPSGRGRCGGRGRGRGRGSRG